MARHDLSGRVVAITGGARGLPRCSRGHVRCPRRAGQQRGCAPGGPLGEASAADVQLQLDVNIGAVITGTRLALHRFVPRGHGHIVNMASSAAMVASANGATYSATKHAVLGPTRALRGELRGSGVATTVVMPGVIRTEMTRTSARRSGFGPSAVGGAVVDALRSGRLEVYVPREVGLQGRLFTTLPARASDFTKRLVRADRVMH